MSPVAAPDDAPGPRLQHPALRLLLFVVTFVVAIALLNAGLIGVGFPAQLQHGVIRPLPQLAAGLMIWCLTLGLSWFFLRKFERRTIETIGLELSGHWRRAALLGLALGALTPAAVLAVLFVNGNASITANAFSLQHFITGFFPSLLATAFISSSEEISLRGYVMQLIAQLGGPRVAAVVTGVVFGLLHAGNPGANVSGLAITALNGVLLAWIVIQTGSLWIACGYHIGWNAAAAVVLGMRDSGIVDGGALLRTELQGPAWLTGGAYGFEGSLLTGVVEVGVLGFLLVNATRLAGVANAQGYFIRGVRQSSQ